MAGEFIHKDVGSQLTEAEYDGVGAHVFNSQATGDIMYASSATQLSRLAAGTQGYPLVMGASVPQWGGAITLNGILSGLSFTNYIDAGASTVYIKTTATQQGLIVESTRDDADGVAIQMRTLSASPANADVLGSIFIYGRTADLTLENTHRVLYMLESNTDDQESGNIEWHNKLAGVLNQAMTLSAAGRLWLDDGLDATTLQGTLTLNSQAFDAGSGSAQINTTGADDGLAIESTQDSNVGPVIKMWHVTANPAVSDVVGRYVVVGVDGAGAPYEWGDIRHTITNIGDGTEAMKLETILTTAGSTNVAMTLSGAGRLWVDADIDFSTSVDSGAVVDHVSLGCFDEGGKRKLAISQEEPVVTEAVGASDRTLPVRLNGTTYKVMLHT